MNAISFFLSRQGKVYTEVVLPNTMTISIQLTIRKYIQQQAKETIIIGKLNLLYGMTTNLNKIRRPLAPGYEADLFYIQCSLMPGFLSEKPRFSRERVCMGMRLFSMLQTLIKICVYRWCFTVHNV